ncbi:hypothetical protein ACFFX0_14625 [Citricoccus parietis]|uniref:Uncharacterized protein n=1 Tax=Citricoccus parietis TaxID=592307 RepID=A0ABV5G121_9MICC
MTSPSSHTSSGSKGMSSNRRDAPRARRFGIHCEMHSAAWSMMVGMGPSKRRSLPLSRDCREPVPGSRSEKRITRTRAWGRYCWGEWPSSRTPATVRSPVRVSRLRALSAVGSSAPAPMASR